MENTVNTTGMSIGAIIGGIALGVLTFKAVSGILVIHATSTAGIYTIGKVSTILLKTSCVVAGVSVGASVGGAIGYATEVSIYG